MDFKVFITSFLKKYAPQLLEWARSRKRKARLRKLEEKKQLNEVITYEMLLQDLHRMGIQKGDSIIVHSSLSRIGYVDGGAATAVNALLSAVGNNGNVLMPSFAHSTFSKYYLDKDPVFDVRNSASAAGAISEEFRRRKGVKRSLHPTDSVAAFGPLADYFTEAHFGELTPYTDRSPYWRLAEKKGKILNIGVPLNTGCTNLHTLEDAVDFKFPVYYKELMNARVIDEHGNLRQMQTKVHDPEFSKKRKPDELVTWFENAGILKHAKFGEAEVLLVDAAGLFETMVRLYKEKGVTMYTPQGS